MTALRTLKDQLKARFREVALSVDDECRIALFLQAVKSANAMILAKVETQSLDWWAYHLLHEQYFKEVELTTMLARTPKWTLNPTVYADATGTTMMLWQKANIATHIMTPLSPGRPLFTYLGLSHAFFAEIRFCQLFPSSWDYQNPFLYALNVIEQENGRQIQAQIRLLKGIDSPDISPAEREQIVEEQRAVVIDIFSGVLRQLLPQEQ